MKTDYSSMAMLLGVLLCMACGSAQTENAGADSKGVLVTAGRLQALDKKSWRLIKLLKADQKVALVQDSEITFSCTGEGTVTGSASINRYSASLKISDTGEIDWGGRAFRMTKMAGPPDLMRQEGVFINSLRKAHRMFVKDTRLILESEDKSVVLEFEKVNH